MSDSRNLLNVSKYARRIGEAFDEDRFRFWTNSGSKTVKVIVVDKADLPAKLLESMGKLIC